MDLGTWNENQIGFLNAAFYLLLVLNFPSQSIDDHQQIHDCAPEMGVLLQFDLSD